MDPRAGQQAFSNAIVVASVAAVSRRQVTDNKLSHNLGPRTTESELEGKNVCHHQNAAALARVLIGARTVQNFRNYLPNPNAHSSTLK